jgi:hypothetical protein
MNKFPLNAEVNPICHLLALLGGATIVNVSRLRVKPYFKVVTFHAIKAHRGSRGTAPLIQSFITSALGGGEWQNHAAAALPPGKTPLYPLNRCLVGPQEWSERAGGQEYL